MSFRDRFAIFAGKSVAWVSKTFGLGAGATWPGEVALSISPDILKPLAEQFRKGVILIAGTNGKTTTSLMIKTVVEYEQLSVIHNASGANLLNGLVSACAIKTSGSETIDADWGIFEVDENSLPIILKYAKPKVLVLLNLFRDQLDRYGEVDVVAEKWQYALSLLTSDTTLVLNADDPLIASLGKKTKASVLYFGLDERGEQAVELEHATDSIFCYSCGSRLFYHAYYFSHLGDWYCKACGEKRPAINLSSWESPLPGQYNLYNTLAAVLTTQTIGIHSKHIKDALKGFAPAFGRQEEREVDGKKIKLLLSKNPAGFNASIRAVLDMKPKAILLALNDRIPDGRDVSWIWDVDFEMIPLSLPVVVTGDRVYDMALRIQYRDSKFESRNTKQLVVEPNVRKAIHEALSMIKTGETLYALPTYSAMLDIRKIVTGRRIL